MSVSKQPDYVLWFYKLIKKQIEITEFLFVLILCLQSL